MSEQSGAANEILLEGDGEDISFADEINDHLWEERRFAAAQRCSFSGKICYSSREADRVLNFVRGRKYNGRRVCRGKAIPRRKYYCSSCQSFHLTHFSFPLEQVLGDKGRSLRNFRRRTLEQQEISALWNYNNARSFSANLL